MSAAQNVSTTTNELKNSKALKNDNKIHNCFSNFKNGRQTVGKELKNENKQKKKHIIFGKTSTFEIPKIKRCPKLSSQLFDKIKPISENLINNLNY